MGALENTTKETLEYIFNHYPTANIHICMPNTKPQSIYDTIYTLQPFTI